MMVGKSRAADEKMKALAEAYAVSLVGRLHALETLAGRLSGGGPFEEIHPPVEEIRALVHKIAGTAGMFGFPSVTDQARAIEEGVRPVIEARQPLTAEQAAAIESQVAALKELIPVKPGPETRPDAAGGATRGKRGGGGVRHSHGATGRSERIARAADRKRRLPGATGFRGCGRDR